jgi:hypothetical protein
MAIVYKITNKTTERGYIGQTVRSMEARWKSHCSSVRQGSKFRFHSAIRKYGFDDWNFEILLESDDMDFIRSEEARLILKEGYQTKGVGYNAKPGGCGGWIVPPEKYEQWRKGQRGQSFGDKNPKFSGFSDDEIATLIYEDLNKSVDGRSITNSIKKVHDLHGTPLNFSGWRFSRYKGHGVARLKDHIVHLFPDAANLFGSVRSSRHNELARENNRGFKWYCDPVTKSSKRFKEQQPDGWIPGRYVNNRKN